MLHLGGENHGTAEETASKTNGGDNDDELQELERIGAGPQRRIQLQKDEEEVSTLVVLLVVAEVQMQRCRCRAGADICRSSAEVNCAGGDCAGTEVQRWCRGGGGGGEEVQPAASSQQPEQVQSGAEVEQIWRCRQGPEEVVQSCR